MRIDESAPISLEAAKLLGLPFTTTVDTNVLFRFRHTDEGQVLQCLWLDRPDVWRNISVCAEERGLFPGLTLYRVREREETDASDR